MKEPDFAFYSDTGGRANNEDACLAKRMEGGYLFVVADGLGGHEDGETASVLAVNSVKDYLADNPGEAISKAIQYANGMILEMQRKKSSKMKTTIALAYVDDSKTIIAHVGDSRIYAFKDKKIVHQSIDHSASQMAVTMGEITPAQIRSHEDRNMLLRALGAEEDVKVDVARLDNSEYDALLLCSDGFWEYVLESDMEAELFTSTSADKWLYKMRSIQLANAPDSCDNNTAITVLRY